MSIRTGLLIAATLAAGAAATAHAATAPAINSAHRVELESEGSADKHTVRQDNPRTTHAFLDLGPTGMSAKNADEFGAGSPPRETGQP